MGRIQPLQICGGQVVVNPFHFHSFNAQQAIFRNVSLTVQNPSIAFVRQVEKTRPTRRPRSIFPKYSRRRGISFVSSALTNALRFKSCFNKSAVASQRGPEVFGQYHLRL
ncbi:hypothetical protein GCM10011498_02510 [Amylibacter cionae]|uniref:Uncharacterized protein n=1 Tax=Neptunicoccus cionae TaxID=2035344 RepID=A0A916QS03_9RHOB|nr:hypothetical protein GCM10011498_02510 [Amylibacter cionae]